MIAGHHNRLSNLSGLLGQHFGLYQDMQLIVESANGWV